MIEAANAGTDTVLSAVSYTLAANIEHLTLTGIDNLDATGNALGNVLTGNTGNNILNGGAGADTMAGGLGNDTYYVDDPGDLVIEGANAGTDLVYSPFSYTLGANVENLILTGTANLEGIGNDLANVLTGNSGNNRLEGGAGNDILQGGLGADTLIGGLGSDTYHVDNEGDVVIEDAVAGSGTDLVHSAISYTLGENVENLVLTGTAHLNGFGNALSNAITGTSGNNRLEGGLGNDTLNGGAGADTLIGGLGNDTYYVDNLGDVVIEAAGEGTDRVFSAISYSLGANVENLTLHGTGTIDGTGNAMNNSIVGNSGNNRLDGGLGSDTMAGGAGNDTYVVDSVGDSVTENVNEGTDTVLSALSYTLGANLENLTLTGTANLDGTGNTLNNVLTGNAGNNRLDGGAGADTMAGGAGNDTYVVDNVGDQVIEAATEGTDTVLSAVSFTLAANVEHLTLTGTANLNGTGNILNNTLTGNAGNNLLNGGAGADTLMGGLGDDTYVVDNVGDVVIEHAGEGTDTVLSSISYTLGDNIENAALTGTASHSLHGNDLGNVLTGNVGNNRLDGGAGADTLAGGLGDDTYVVDNTGDSVTEGANAGIDRVESAISYTLGANLENLTLTGVANIDGTGNTLGNLLEGNAGNNRLNGGVGADTMAGGAGNDTYSVDNVGDQVVEYAGEGTDAVQSSVSFTLGDHIEHLTLVGSAPLDGIGNDLDNILTGNSGANRLAGGDGNDRIDAGSGNDTLEGGAGNDILIGGYGNDLLIGGQGNDTLTGNAGADVFRFVTVGEGHDTLTDFESGLDRLEVVSPNFGGLPAGPLAASRLVNASTPLTSGAAVFVYNPASGLLTFDADGNGAGAAAPIATLSGPKTLVAGDIHVLAA